MALPIANMWQQAQGAVAQFESTPQYQAELTNVLGGKTPEQLAQIRGLPIEQSNLLTQRLVRGNLAYNQALAARKAGASNVMEWDAYGRAFGPREPWAVQGLRAERQVRTVEQLLGGKTPEQLAQIRGVSVEQSNALNQRIAAAEAARLEYRDAAPYDGKQQSAAAKSAFGQPEPWMADAMARERLALAGPPGQPAEGSKVLNGVISNPDGSPAALGLPASWGESATSIFSDITQAPGGKDGAWQPDPRYIGGGFAPRDQGIGLEGLTGEGFNERYGKYGMAALGAGLGGPAGAQVGYLAGDAVYGKPGDAAERYGGATGSQPTGGYAPGIPGAGGAGGATAATEFARQRAEQLGGTTVPQLGAGPPVVSRGMRRADGTGFSPAVAGPVDPYAIQATQIQAGQNVANQQEAIGYLRDAAIGRVPSAAELMLQQRAGMDQAAQLGLAAAMQNGRSVGGALNTAARNQAMLASDAARNAGVLRAQEQATARGQFAETVGTARGQDIDLGKAQGLLDQDANKFNSGARLDVDKTNIQNNFAAQGLANDATSVYVNAANGGLASERLAWDKYRDQREWKQGQQDREMGQWANLTNAGINLGTLWQNQNKGTTGSGTGTGAGQPKVTDGKDGYLYPTKV